MPDPAVDQETLQALTKRFRHFAEAECRNYSPLYEQLSLAIAADEALRKLAAHVPPGQPTPNLLFAAVYDCLLRDPDQTLAEFYPNLTNSLRPVSEAFPHFRRFCLAHQAEIMALLQSRRVQTNEVSRCAYLFPAFSLIFDLARRPLSLVEIGTSAGLNLLWDHYRYHYGDGFWYGHHPSAVAINSVFRGDKRPRLPRLMPPISERIGLDLNIIDAGDAADVRWIRALIWPEHQARVELLNNALAVVRAHPPQLIEGDGTSLLPGVLAGLAPETAVCIFHTHTFNQVHPETRQQFAAFLADYSRQRPIYRLACEGIDPRTPPQLMLTTYHQGRQTETLLAYCDAHARWIEWMHAPA